MQPPRIMVPGTFREISFLSLLEPLSREIFNHLKDVSSRFVPGTIWAIRLLKAEIKYFETCLLKILNRHMDHFD